MVDKYSLTLADGPRTKALWLSTAHPSPWRHKGATFDVPFDVLQGKVLASITNTAEEIIFTTKDGEFFRMYHYPDCCESVTVEDIVGDLNNLIGRPVLQAEESTNSGINSMSDTYTWTYYLLSTVKGSVTIRWYGSSNGYYSEAVSFERIV